MTMQPLAKFGPRLLFDSIASSTTPSSLRSFNRLSHHRSLIRPSFRLPCNHRFQNFQARFFADSSRPPSASASSSSSTPSEPSTPSAPSTSPEPSLETDNSASNQDAELPSAQEGRRSAVTKRLTHLMDNLQGNIFIASQRLNDLTGYSGIEALKVRITALEQHVQECREAVRAARARYKTTVAERAASQREVTALLARKDTWTPVDLERFTSLYRSDHGNEQAVQESSQKLAEAEREAEHSAAQLSSAILSRYHEEQIWSDKIRRMSTWGTWGLMGVNILLFLVFQLGFEPWRRRRLVNGFEEKVRKALEQDKLAQLAREGEPLEKVVAAGVQEFKEEVVEGETVPVPAAGAAMAGVETLVEEANDAVPPSLVKAHLTPYLKQLGIPEKWQAVIEDLFSERIILLRKQDITIIAIESAATGAAIVGVIAATLLRRS
ncbi:mitochondrion biogenesis protein-like protein [Xylogone sp. PMI_703]|nr:mitochondrion biogenesis protein-like protein [Xylogone sp. PMI_703]